ncbi:hypothetical protein LCGC14_0197280 [marine sediment metagenome]|uniref:Uncharacterized protein n=1 Tax=marine sediment metagenome TaxID=412755 RepID=A0A0F9UPG7_9ZZZZ
MKRVLLVEDDSFLILIDISLFFDIIEKQKGNYGDKN